jgi:tyrosyl-tRNA synthetase
MSDILTELAWRGLIQQVSDQSGLEAALTRPITLYSGFDPTADSLHVGNLIPLITLMRFNEAGHRAIALVGGATGLIGDPSGKAVERTLQTPEQAKAQATKVQEQIQKLVPDVVNNLSWTAPMAVLEFLREVGKHFSVNAMLARDSVKGRLDREGEGISFTEFSYMLLQSFDFFKLHEAQNCVLQVGGSDQWGNICSGTDLIRRKTGNTAFGLTLPLLTTHDGKKFGKSEKGAIWLSAEKTSVLDFFQFWLNADDADVIKLLKLFTFYSQSEIEALAVSVSSAPHLREAQKALALAVTTLVHGEAAARQVQGIIGVLFGKAGVATLSVEDFEALANALPTQRVSNGQRVTSMLVATALEPSMSAAARTIKGKGLTANGHKIENPDCLVGELEWAHSRFVLLQKGKKNFALLIREPEC